ncbi:MAG TPA: TIGR00366 family protein [Polyangiaceae bacterium]|jgi:short-chain fatty acids transporter
MSEEPSSALARVASRFTAWTERWIPDAFVFALLATFVVLVAGVASRAGHAGLAAATGEVVGAWGQGFFSAAILKFTIEMALVIITGYVVATSPPVGRLIVRLASLPREPRRAVAMIAIFAMGSSWLNWGFSLVFSAMLAKEVARRVKGVDYRAAAAASFLGLGSVWAQGLSGSAALQMATPSALPKDIRAIVAAGDLVPGGMIPLTKTIFLWQSLLSVVVEIALVTAVMYLATPVGKRARTAEQMGIDLGESPLDRPAPASKGTPGEALEHSTVPSMLFVVLATAYLVRYFRAASDPLYALDLDRINLAFLTIGVALHGTPARLMRAVKEATPGVWGVILQFPFYGAIAAIITTTHLNEHIAHALAKIAGGPAAFPGVIAVYSLVLGVFVPSGGSKWVIEAPYVMQAAHDLKVHLGWMVSVYDLGEALANLVQPFWMLPILGLFGLRARDVMGYTFLVFVVLVPVVLVMVTVFGLTLHYPLAG